MARKFVAAFYSNCAHCEEVIEPGDDAGFVRSVEGSVCEDCLEELAEAEELAGDVFWDQR